MPAPINALMQLEMPVIVRMGEKLMRAKDVTALQPGTIIELPKGAEEPLDLLINNRAIASGTAVKVGENFGIRLEHVGDVKDLIQAMGEPEDGAAANTGEVDADALAEQLLAAQGLGGD